MGIGLEDAEGQFETHLLPLGGLVDLKTSLTFLPVARLLLSLAPPAEA